MKPYRVTFYVNQILHVLLLRGPLNNIHARNLFTTLKESLRTFDNFPAVVRLISVSQVFLYRYLYLRPIKKMLEGYQITGWRRYFKVLQCKLTTSSYVCRLFFHRIFQPSRLPGISRKCTGVFVYLQCTPRQRITANNYSQTAKEWIIHSLEELKFPPEKSQHRSKRVKTL